MQLFCHDTRNQTQNRPALVAGGGADCLLRDWPMGKAK
jgi:hypothetical protein